MTSPRQSHYETGEDWEYETYLRLTQSKRRAWVVAAVASAVAVLSLFALVLVLPLKEFAPYVVTVHDDTGYLEVTRGLEPGDLSEDEAVTSANVVRCLTAHETFDATDYRENYDYVNLCMADQALENYRRLFTNDHPDNPIRNYGYDTTVRVQIKSLQLLTEETAQVRFQTVKTNNGRDTVEHWIAVLTFRYVQKPTALADRFQNPLGFQITRYRRDQELVTTQQPDTLMTTKTSFALLLLSLPLMALAERQPQPGAADARVRHVTYNPRDVVNVVGHYGYQTLIQFAEYEQIENISIGDSLAWQVVPNERGNLLFLKPIERNAETNLTVVTSAPTTENGTGLSQRIYVFSLRANSADHHDSDKFTWTVRFHYPEDERALINLRDHQQALVSGSTLGESLEPSDWNFNYSFSGSREQVPVKIFDNGTFTYFEFDQRTDTPAIFLVDANQNESLVNGVRQGKYVVVHRVGQQFTLRNGDVVTCIFNDAYDGDPLLDQGSPAERATSQVTENMADAVS